MSNITIKELKEAIVNLPDDAILSFNLLFIQLSKMVIMLS